MGETQNPRRIGGVSGQSMTVDHLRGKDLDDYFEGTEQPEFVLTNEKRGLKRENDDGTVQFKPGSEHDAVAAMTDERVPNPA